MAQLLSWVAAAAAAGGAQRLEAGDQAARRGVREHVLGRRGRPGAGRAGLRRRGARGEDQARSGRAVRDGARRGRDADGGRQRGRPGVLLIGPGLGASTSPARRTAPPAPASRRRSRARRCSGRRPASGTAVGDGEAFGVDVAVGVGFAVEISTKSARSVSPPTSVTAVVPSPFVFVSSGAITLTVYLPGQQLGEAVLAVRAGLPRVGLGAERDADLGAGDRLRVAAAGLDHHEPADGPRVLVGREHEGTDARCGKRDDEPEDEGKRAPRTERCQGANELLQDSRCIRPGGRAPWADGLHVLKKTSDGSSQPGHSSARYLQLRHIFALRSERSYSTPGEPVKQRQQDRELRPTGP